MSEMDDKAEAEILELGKILSAANPNVSPYEVARKLMRDQAMNWRETRNVADYADASTSPNLKDLRSRSASLNYKPAHLEKEASKLYTNPKDKNDWIAGILGHEVLGHGTDLMMAPDTFDEGFDDQTNHFLMYKSYKEGVPHDSIASIIEAAKLQQLPPKQRIAREAAARSEANARGLPLYLPKKAKWER